MNSIGATVDVPNLNNDTALTATLGAGLETSAELLIKHGANIHQVNNYGFSVLMHAIHESEVQVKPIFPDSKKDVHILFIYP